MLADATAHGLHFKFPASDTHIGGSLRDFGEFAQPEVDLICDLLTDGGDFIDVGANIGAIALPVAKRRPASRVLAIEASASLAPVLGANLIASGLDNVSLLHAAAGPRREIAEFPDVPLSAEGNHGAIGFRYKPGEVPRRPVLMLPLDELTTPATKVIKIDVEGFELEVLKGASRTLETIRPSFLFEANPSVQGDVTPDAIRLLLAANYNLFWFFAPHGTPLAPRTKPANADMGDTNILAMPAGVRSGWLLARIKDPTATRPTHRSAYPYLAERYGYANQ